MAGGADTLLRDANLFFNEMKVKIDYANEPEGGIRNYSVKMSLRRHRRMCRWTRLCARGEMMEGKSGRWARVTGGAAAVLAAAILVAGCADFTDISYMERMSNESSRRGAEAFASGDSSQALERFREALRIDRSIENRGAELHDLMNLGRVYTSMGRFSEATDFLNEAITLGVNTRESGMLSEAHEAFASAEYLAGNAGTALDHIDEAIQIDSGMGVRSGAKLNIKGMIYTEAGRRGEAAGILKEALEINSSEGDKLETANSYRALGDLFSADGLRADALGYYRKAYEMDLQEGDSRKISGDLVRMAEILLSLGDKAKAAFLFERSYVVGFNSGRRGSPEVLDKVIGVYSELGESAKAAFYQKVKDGIGAGNQTVAR